MPGHFHYNRNLRHFARSHRKDSTKAEVRLWCELLRDGQLLGYRFLRQRPIGNYIADFFCKELNLIIEVDGLSHQFAETAVSDREREANLTNMGYRILRFDDNEVMNDLLNVQRTLEFWIEDFEAARKQSGR
ncbi:MAG: hypothetical protein K0S09_3136 [Sphingobacteriaceae bacterium]|jgi:very-short-patch-repair endonuclease|nr:hypothetical protein [Sphingobacteriaceae bacterium]